MKIGKKYYDKSCPKCGLPSQYGPYVAINRFGSIPPKEARHKLKCKICGSFLHPELQASYHAKAYGNQSANNYWTESGAPRK